MDNRDGRDASGRFQRADAHQCPICGSDIETRHLKYCGGDCLALGRSASGPRRWWSPEEDELLRELYERHLPAREIATALNRTTQSVYEHIRTLRLRRAHVPQSPSGTLERLLDSTPAAAYWLGFIAADGSFDNRGRLKVTLAIKDRHHLEKMSAHLQASLTITEDRRGHACTIALMDTFHAALIADRFDLAVSKTYNPPRWLPFTDDGLLRSFLIGFIDGDGYIRRQSGRRSSAISTVSHLSWKPFLVQLSDALRFGQVGERSGGEKSSCTYAALTSFRHNDNVALKRFAVEQGLPILNRKWDRIDESLHISKTENARKLREMVSQGSSIEEITRELGCSVSRVRQVRGDLKKRALLSDGPHT